MSRCATVHPTAKRGFVRSIAIAAAAVAFTAPTADAQINFAGYTLGCFGPAGLGCTPSSSSAALAGLTYTGVGSDATPVAFGTSVGGSLNGVNIGQFKLASDPGNVNSCGFLCWQNAFNGQQFNLQMNFTLPGTGEQMFSALLSGSFLVDQSGIVYATFGTSPYTVNYTTASGHGSFNVRIAGDGDENTCIGVIGCLALGDFNSPTTATIHADISNATFTATPEPGTIALLATGLVALGGFGASRRRRQQSAA